MDARAIITSIREGQGASQEQLQWFANGLASGAVTDAQAGAFAMAVLLRGLGDEGRTALTRAMCNSGKTLQWSLGGPVIDKHSTGGIGDCLSLVLAPALAACGAYVPMISGRGLGHTGGTLDKLEAIPGVSVELGEDQFRHVVSEIGCAIVAATDQIAPADRRLYAVRDVTATVESMDLITASILSKKLAAGLDGLVLDVKLGSGALMKDPVQALALANSLVDTANAAGCRTSAVISDMNQPLAPAVGNALEVAAAIRVLTGETKGTLAQLAAALGGVALCNAGLCSEVEKGAAQILASLSDGRAAETFGQMVSAQGGPVNFVESWGSLLPEAPVIREVACEKSGYVCAMDGAVLGQAGIELGGGRKRDGDIIDPAVGLSEITPLGAKVSEGQPLLRIHANRVEHADHVEAMLREAIEIGGTAEPVPPLLYDRIG